MTLQFDPIRLPAECEALRREVRAFLAEEIAAGTFDPHRPGHGDSHNPGFSKRIGAKGWIGMTWPKKYGGQERSFLERYVVTEEFRVANAPVRLHFVADRQSGPILLKYAPEPIKQNILPQLPEAVRRYYERARPIELRPVDFDRYRGKRPEGDRFSIWLRTTAPLPDDPAIHRCALAYASDMNLLDAALVPHGRSVFDRSIMGASLDHALWFHRPFRADQWLLYTLDSPNMSGSRGFGRGLVFAADGTLVASAAQEGLLRERRAEPKPA